MDNKDKNLLAGLERERFSNFVVDLRKIETRTERSLKKEAKKIERQWSLGFKQFGRVAGSLRLNLLADQESVRHKFKKFGLISSVKNCLSRLNFFSIFKHGKQSLFRPVPKKQSAWREFIGRQAKIYNAVPQPPLNSLAAVSRLSKAEEKVFWYRSILSFIIVLVLIIIPFKILAYFQVFDFKNWEKRIMARSEFAFSDLLAATDSVSKMNFKEADSRFQAASANFLAAESDLSRINDAILSLAAFSNDPNIKLAAESRKFLQAGSLTSSLGSNLAQATGRLFNEGEPDFSKRLDSFLLYGNLASRDAQNLQQVLSSIKTTNLPDAYRTKFEDLNKQAGLLSNNLVNFISLGDKLKEVLGLSRDKRYLVVFQNNTELRASGGFIGSYALVDFKNGRISNLEVPGGGSYDTEAGQQVRVLSPEPLWLLNPLWHFWDANWWPDWPMTAQNLMWFYAKSGGPSVDGVIGLTPTVLERLLEITGPIDLQAEYGLTIDANNFWETVQKVTEQKNLAKTNPAAVVGIPATSTVVKSDWPLEQGLETNLQNKPKKIIGDLLVKILAVLPQKLNRDNLVKVMALFEENMSEKQIMLYFKDPYLQSEIVSQNWAGEIRSTDHDYLSIVNTNIGGQKSDRLMSEKINLRSEVEADGIIINTLKISRTHNGLKGEPLTGVRNVDWVRIYVPAGSELLSADGFQPLAAKYFKPKPEGVAESLSVLDAERAAAVDVQTGTKIYREKDKTVLANWFLVNPGETSVVTIKYRLPFNFFTVPASNDWLKRFNRWLNPEFGNLWAYSLLVQKQAGSRPSELESELILPSGYQVFWHYPDSLDALNGWSLKGTLNRDRYWSILAKDSIH